MVKNLPAMWKTQIPSLGQEDALEKKLATHSSILDWRIPRTENAGGLQSLGSQRVGLNWVTNTHTHMHTHTHTHTHTHFPLEPATQNVVCRPAASASSSPGGLLEMQNLETQPRPPASVRISILISSPRMSMWKFEKFFCEELWLWSRKLDCALKIASDLGNVLYFPTHLFPHSKEREMERNRDSLSIVFYKNLISFKEVFFLLATKLH